MTQSIDFTLDLACDIPKTGTQVVGVFLDKTLTCQESHEWVSQVQEFLKDNNLKEGEKLWINTHVLAVGMGQPVVLKEWQEAGARCANALPANKPGTLLMDALSAENVAAVAYGCELSAWRLERFRTKARPLSPKCTHVIIVTPHATDVELKKQRYNDHHVVRSVHWARDIANRPGNDITPENFMKAVDEFKALGIKVNVLDENMLKAQGFGALLGVAQGSANKPYLVTALWQGAGPDAPTLALVGKGVTFDSGGISIKPSNNMGEMKLDKTGAVVVAAAVRALALQKASVNVVAVLALVENMPSGTAQRPGDIVISLSGQTIEVLDTDAEGRLILADALTYTQNTFAPAAMIDVATLTGAVRVALGSVYAGAFSYHKDLVDELIESGRKTGEELWHLPLHKEYEAAMNGTIADIKNLAGPGFGAGSSTAAQFLARFVNKDQVWAHLDIAGVDMAGKETPTCPPGGSAFGVQLLVDWALNYQVKKPSDTAVNRSSNESHD